MKTSSRRIACAAALALSHVATAFGISVTQTKPGNVFTTSEQPAFALSGTGTGVDWSVKNYLGQVVATGTVALVSGTATLSPSVSQPGWFELNLTEKTGSTTLGTFATTFARVTPATLSGSSPYGAQTHFAQFTGTASMANIAPLLDIISRGGISHIRDEQYWQHIERTKGDFSTFPTAFTTYMAEAAARGVTPLITADWSNSLYDFEYGEQTAPHTTEGVAPEGIPAYANYVKALRTKYGTQIPAIEIWNEYNGTFAKGDAAFNADRPLHYSNMLKKTYEVVKQTHPSVKIIAGGVVPVAHGFLNRIFYYGSMPYLDAVSVHPYRAFPEGVELEMSELKELIKSYNGGQTKPIWATEFSKNVTQASDRLAGAYELVQQAVMMRNVGVERMYYYLTAEDGNFPYRGLVRKSNAAEGKYVPNPGFVAYSTLIGQTHDWTPNSRVTAGLKRTTYAYKLTKPGQTRHVLWATSPTTVEISGTQALTKVDTMGVTTTLTPQSGKILLPLGADPCYVTGTATAFADVNNLVLADSASDYDKTQGANGWSYGYATLGSSDPYLPTNFQPLVWAIWKGDNYRWKKGSSDYPFATIGTMHPGGSDWAIKRWQSPVAGKIRIEGSAEIGSNTTDGVTLRIFVDGIEVYTEILHANDSITFNLPEVTVQAGSKVDFAIAKMVETTNDATEFRARIFEVAAAPALAAPTNLTAQGVADNRIQLFWQDNAQGETGYEIQWKWGTQAYAAAATAGADATAYLHSSNMAGGRVYSYRVRAISGTEVSAWSNEASSAEGSIVWYSTQYALTVSGGNNDGSYYAGTIVPVTAAAPPAGQVFDEWTGDVSAVADPTAASTTVTMPAAAVAITAAYGFGGSNEGANWTSSDIGSVGQTGSFSYDQPTAAFTVIGSGADIWGAADAFHFARRIVKLSGNGTIIARVQSLTNTHDAAKAGVMIRETTAANSKYAYAKVSPANGLSFQYRTSTGGNSSGASVSGVNAPQWLKLTRSGSQFSAYYSSDGATWTQVGSTISITMAADVEVGLAVTSHNNSALCTAVIGNVSVTSP